jgi:hypothetical protein
MNDLAHDLVQALAAVPTFRGAALRAQTLRVPELMLAGPAETGKTMGALWLLDTLLSTTPKAQAGMVRKVRSDMEGTVLATYRQIVARSGSRAHPYGGSKPEWYDYPNDARVYIGGMDNPGKVLSGDRDWIFVNQAEQLTVDDWETLSTRTTGRGAVTKNPMLFGDCNPGPADHWILRRRDAGALLMLESHHEDNPTLYDAHGQLTPQGERTMAALRLLTGVRKLRLWKGLWVGAEGQFYEEWDEEIHTCDPFPIPADWPVWGAFDYGFAHNTAFGLFTAGDGIVYQIGEHVQNKWLPSQHARAMDALLARVGVVKARLSRIVAGHDVFQQRGDDAGETIADKYAKLGYAFEPATLDRINGAAEIMARLGNATEGLPATFRIFTSCPRTIACIPAMVHDPRNSEDVLKTNAESDGSGGDDPYDCLRYGLMAEQVPATGFSYSYDPRMPTRHADPLAPTVQTTESFYEHYVHRGPKKPPQDRRAWVQMLDTKKGYRG